MSCVDNLGISSSQNVAGVTVVRQNGPNFGLKELLGVRVLGPHGGHQNTDEH
jgi:hypothetical protein